jgi:ferrous iron transport protein A
MTFVPLTQLEPGADAVVGEVLPPAAPQDRELVLRLIEIGFLPGERVRVIARGQPGDEPIAVRLGHTTFALRRFEAAFIRVQPEAAAQGLKAA